jgi:hypothetical protein
VDDANPERFPFMMFQDFPFRIPAKTAVTCRAKDGGTQYHRTMGRSSPDIRSRKNPVFAGMPSSVDDKAPESKEDFISGGLPGGQILTTPCHTYDISWSRLLTGSALPQGGANKTDFLVHCRKKPQVLQNAHLLKPRGKPLRIESGEGVLGVFSKCAPLLGSCAPCIQPLPYQVRDKH